MPVYLQGSVLECMCKHTVSMCVWNAVNRRLCASVRALACTCSSMWISSDCSSLVHYPLVFGQATSWPRQQPAELRRLLTAQWLDASAKVNKSRYPALREVCTSSKTGLGWFVQRIKSGPAGPNTISVFDWNLWVQLSHSRHLIRFHPT